MNFEELEKYIKEKRKATIPEVQQKFGLKYGETRQVFQKLQSENKIRFIEGITFEWCLLEGEEREEFIRKRRQELQERLARIRAEQKKEEDDDLELAELFDDDDEDEDDSSPKTAAPVIPSAKEKRELVTLQSVLDSDEYKHSKGKLNFVVGKDLTKRNVVVADLAELPHLLVAGTTGSGKSVVLNSIIVSLAKKYSPDYVKFLLVDTRKVELTQFDGLPHMLTHEVLSNPQDALGALDYLIEEMERRYGLFRASKVGNIAEYNAQSSTKLPYLVFAVDELADIMFRHKKEFESRLLRLAQKCRASGIHIVLATQRPDVYTVSGTVKASIPARIALRVASKYDSITLIGDAGAEQLLGHGDMLYMSVGFNGVQRLQSAFVSGSEIFMTIVECKEKYSDEFNGDAENKIFLSRKATTTVAPPPPTNTEPDPLCRRALRFWLEKQSGRASIASIQRNLGIGFNRAGRIMDYCQRMGYVEQLKETDPSCKPVRVLITAEELARLFPDQDDD